MCYLSASQFSSWCGIVSGEELVNPTHRIHARYPQSKMRKILSIFLLFFLFSCNGKENRAKQKNRVIDTGSFEITVSGNWEYIEDKGIDSFVGKFLIHNNDEKYTLSFDFSSMGYASNLIYSEYEYIYDQQPKWMPQHLFLKPGIIYTSGDIEATKKQEMHDKGITDSTLVIVESIPKPEVKIVKEYTDSNSYEYIAHLTYKDSMIKYNIDLPEELLRHHVIIDTVGDFSRKLIYPKIGHSGITGVYFKHLYSELNLQINGKDLPIEIREQTVESFKSIKIKY
jgi:hypothetical protein